MFRALARCLFPGGRSLGGIGCPCHSTMRSTARRLTWHYRPFAQALAAPASRRILPTDESGGIQKVGDDCGHVTGHDVAGLAANVDPLRRATAEAPGPGYGGTSPPQGSSCSLDATPSQERFRTGRGHSNLTCLQFSRLPGGVRVTSLRSQEERRGGMTRSPGVCGGLISEGHSDRGS